MIPLPQDSIASLLILLGNDEDLFSEVMKIVADIVEDCVDSYSIVLGDNLPVVSEESFQTFEETVKSYFEYNYT